MSLRKLVVTLMVVFAATNVGISAWFGVVEYGLLVTAMGNAMMASLYWAVKVQVRR